LALTRQKVDIIDRQKFAAASGLRQGGYILAEATNPEGNETTPTLILIGTGSEVSLALKARETLQGEGVPTRVVSLPCWELFEEQSEEYREKVLPAAVTARVSVEAGVSLGWDRYVGPAGVIIGLDRFGASAPGDVALKNLGFNVEHVVKSAKSLL
jgi:transketolase